jgi:hypothetical protein
VITQSPEPQSVQTPPPSAAKGTRGPFESIVVATIVLVGVIGYVMAGFAFAAIRVSGADRTLNNVISHQSSLNKTLDDVNSTFQVLSSSTTYNPIETRSAVAQWIAGAQFAGVTIRQDDAALVDASARLNELQWLTVFSRSSLDREGARIAHARRALASARTVAADYLLDGLFWDAFVKSTADLDAMTAAAANSDWTGARSSLALMQSDTDSALQLAGAPGLPPELHAAMADFQTFAADYGKLVDASQSGDGAGVSSATSAIQADANRLGTYDFDKITSEISTFYKPMIDAFNSEMAQAAT